MSIETGVFSVSREIKKIPEKPAIEERLRAFFKNWNKQKGFGFIELSDGRRAFCHVSALCEHIKPARGQAPDDTLSLCVGNVLQSVRGLAAEKVECGACAAPEEWELQPVGTEVFGMREMRPVCVNKTNKSLCDSGIPFETVQLANEPYRDAQRKLALWELPEIGDNFFEAFGEPQSIHVPNPDGTLIILEYPHGEKIVHTVYAMDSNHWETLPSGTWKENCGNISAEFTFPKISGAKAWRTVASFSSINPNLEKEFDLLPEETQQAVLTKVREKVLTPVAVAEKCFHDFMTDNGKENAISELRKAICLLQVPGQMILGSISYKAQEELRGSYGDESWGTGRRTDVQHIRHVLTTGLREKEQYHGWGGQYESEHEIKKREVGETAEQVRDRLIVEKRQEIGTFFDCKKRMIGPPSPDTRLYTLDSETWSNQYGQRWDEMQREVEGKWEAEDSQFIAKAKQEWDQYEGAADDLRLARQEAEKVEAQANELKVFSGHMMVRPDFGIIGLNTVAQMQEKTRAIKSYTAALRSEINNTNRLHNERAARNVEEERKKSQEEAEIAQLAAPVRLTEPIPLPEVTIEELPRLSTIEKNKWWFHELPGGTKHTQKLDRDSKTAYDNGERIDVRCSACPNSPFVGYVQK